MGLNYAGVVKRNKLVYNMELKIKMGCYKPDFILDLPDKGIISLDKNDSELIVDNTNKFVLPSLGGEYYKSISTLDVLSSEMLNQGIFVERKKMITSYDTIIKTLSYNKKNRYLSILNKIMNIKDNYRYRFSAFKYITDGTILTVVFRGHEVSGSYTPAYKVYPKYAKIIEQAILRKVKFIEYGNTPWGCACYTFDIDLSHKLYKLDFKNVLIGDEQHFLYYLGFHLKSSFGSGYSYYTWIDDTDIPDEYKSLHIGFYDVDNTYFDVGEMMNHKNNGGISKLLYLHEFIDFLKDKGLLKYNDTPIKDYMNKKHNDLSYRTCSWEMWLLNPGDRNFRTLDKFWTFHNFNDIRDQKKYEKLKSEFMGKESSYYLKYAEGFRKLFLKKYGKCFD